MTLILFAKIPRDCKNDSIIIWLSGRGLEYIVFIMGMNNLVELERLCKSSIMVMDWLSWRGCVLVLIMDMD